MNSKKKNHSAVVAMILGALCIAFAPIFVRLSELAPTQTAFQRMFIAMPFLAVWMMIQKPAEVPPKGALPKGRWVWLLLSGAFFAGDLTVWHWSLAFTSVANATFLANLSPIFVTLGAWAFFKERITARFIAGMLTALVGAAFMVRASFHFGSDFLVGDFLGMSAAVLYAGYLISVKELRRSFPTGKVMFLSSLISCVFLFVFSHLAGGEMMASTAYGWLVLIGLALISQVGGQGLIAYGLGQLSAPLSSVILLLQPVIAVFLAWIILNEALTFWHSLGAIAVLIGIWLAKTGKPL